MNDLAAKFQEALDSFDVDSLKECIEQGVDVNTAHAERHYTPLMAAAHEYNVDAVNHFLALGADVDHQDVDGETAIGYLFANYDNALDGISIAGFKVYLLTSGKPGGQFKLECPNKNDALMAIVHAILEKQPDLEKETPDNGSVIECLKLNTGAPFKIRQKVYELFDAYIENRRLNQAIMENEINQKLEF